MGDLRDGRAEALKPEELRDQMTHESREEGRSKGKKVVRWMAAPHIWVSTGRTKVDKWGFYLTWKGRERARSKPVSK